MQTPEVAGSNPVPATRKTRYLNEKSLRYRVLYCPKWPEGPEKGHLFPLSFFGHSP